MPVNQWLGVMSATTVTIAICAILLVAYVLSAPIAFAMMCRICGRLPSHAASTFYFPLGWLAHRSKIFGRLYNALCAWSYRLIIRGPLHGDRPQPPPPPQKRSGV